MELVRAPAIQKRILVVRERQVMVDEDLADLYGVETRHLVQQVKRNIERFPADFMFQLTREEAAALRSQTVTSDPGRGGRHAPYVFTEQGVAMLSGVLRSGRSPSTSRSCGRSSSYAAPRLPTPRSRGGSNSSSERPGRSSASKTSSWARSSRPFGN
jgi:hypothetical protein